MPWTSWTVQRSKFAIDATKSFSYFAKSEANTVAYKAYVLCSCLCRVPDTHGWQNVQNCWSLQRGNVYCHDVCSICLEVRYCCLPLRHIAMPTLRSLWLLNRNKLIFKLSNAFQHQKEHSWEQEETGWVEKEIRPWKTAFNAYRLKIKSGKASENYLFLIEVQN